MARVGKNAQRLVILQRHKGVGLVRRSIAMLDRQAQGRPGAAVGTGLVGRHVVIDGLGVETALFGLVAPGQKEDQCDDAPHPAHPDRSFLALSCCSYSLTSFLTVRFTCTEKSFDKIQL